MVRLRLATRAGRGHLAPTARCRRPAVVAAVCAAAVATTLLPATATAVGAGRGPLTAHQDGTGPGFDGDGVPNLGDAPDYGGIADIPMDAPATAMAATPDGGGYWVVAADGGIFAFGDAGYYGSMGGRPLYAPIVGMAATPDGDGYWLVAADGGIFAFGDAGYYGSMGGYPLAQPIVGMAATPDGHGYWLVAADGGIFAFGDAPFLGSAAALDLQQPIVGMTATDSGQGYWLVAADGGIFAYGDAPFYGSAANDNLGAWVTGMAATPGDKGYWMVAATAGVLTFGDAGFYGPSPNDPPFAPTAAIAATPDGKGYWLLQPEDGALDLAPISPTGDWAGGASAVQVAEDQVGPDDDETQGAFCNPYGPCEEWCALFATWVWQQIGIGVPGYAFTGDVYTWAEQNGTALPATALPQPGDFIMYGTGPQNSATSPHMGVVAQVWPDGAVVTVEGDAGPEPTGGEAVVANGPFLPSDAVNAPAVGYPVYGYVQP